MKTLLLDFDGVIFRNNRLHNVVSHKCEGFVKKHIKTTLPNEINKQLYQSTGHTLIGLKKLGVKPLPTIEEFNDYVYKDIPYSDVLSSLDDKQTREIKSLKRICNITTPYIFSNAPDIWTNTITELVFDTQFPTTTQFTNPYIKPDRTAFLKVEKHLKSDHYIFVDDKIQNLPFISSKWTRVWMNDKDTLKVQDDLYFITELEMLLYMEEFCKPHLIL